MKRPDYGNATPEDIARALITGPQGRGRSTQPGPGASIASRSRRQRRKPSAPEYRGNGGYASRQTPGRNGPGASG